MSINVLIFGLSNNLGGMETYVYNSYKNMDHKIIHFDFVTTSPINKPMAFEEDYIKMGSKIFHITKRTENWFRSNNEIKKILLKNQYDYIHFHIMNYMWWEPIILTSRYTKAKIILHSHNSKLDKKTFFKNFILDTIGRIKTRNVNALYIACGEDAGKYLFKKNNFKIMKNGVQVEKYRFNKEYRKDVRNEFKIGFGCRLFGHVGNFYIAKNYPKLISIFEAYLKYDNTSKMILVGNYNNDLEIVNMIRKKGLEGKIILAGMRTDIEKFYSAFDVFLFPSLYEGLSISLIEAQVSGVFCFASSKIDKASKISNRFEFIDIDLESKDIAKMIYDCKTDEDDRNNVLIDKSYDIKESSLKLQRFYLENLK